MKEHAVLDARLTLMSLFKVQSVNETNWRDGVECGSIARRSARWNRCRGGTDLDDGANNRPLRGRRLQEVNG